MISSYEGSTPTENERLDQYRLKCKECGYIDMEQEHDKDDFCPCCKEHIKTQHGICPACDEPSPDEYCVVCGDEILLKEYDLYNEEWV